MKGKRNRARKGLMAALAAMMLLAGLTACSSASRDENLSANVARDGAVLTSKAAAPAAQASSAPAERAGQGEVGAGAVTADSAIGGGIGPIADANAGYGRKVVYQANLAMKVKEFRAAEEQLMDLIALSGAYVLQFADSANANEIGGTYVVKVPSEGFSSFLDRLKGIESLKFEREVKGNDVTEEYVDLEARLKAKTTVEERLLSFMDKATGTDDLVKFSNELARVQEEIEQIKGRIRYLDENVAFSTVHLRLYQTSGLAEIQEDPPQKSALGDRIVGAWKGSGNVLRQIGEGLLVALAAIFPVLAVVGAVGAPVYYVVRKRNAARRAAREQYRRAWNAGPEESNKTEDGKAEAGDPATRPADDDFSRPPEPGGTGRPDPEDGGR